MTHEGYRLRIVVEQVISEHTQSSDPRESFTPRAMTHREETIELDVHSFAGLLTAPYLLDHLATGTVKR